MFAASRRAAVGVAITTYKLIPGVSSGFSLYPGSDNAIRSIAPGA